MKNQNFIQHFQEVPHCNASRNTEELPYSGIRNGIRTIGAVSMPGGWRTKELA